MDPAAISDEIDEADGLWTVRLARTEAILQPSLAVGRADDDAADLGVGVRPAQVRADGEEALQSAASGASDCTDALRKSDVCWRDVRAAIELADVNKRDRIAERRLRRRAVGPYVNARADVAVGTAGVA